jgi:hypothetical protein
MAAHFAEMGVPLAENWDGPEFDPPNMPHEAMLLWPEGEWDEEAFVAGQVGDKPASE